MQSTTAEPSAVEDGPLLADGGSARMAADGNANDESNEGAALEPPPERRLLRGQVAGLALVFSASQNYWSAATTVQVCAIGVNGSAIGCHLRNKAEASTHNAQNRA